MKCLHCGTDLDRLSKLRGTSEYCSEECKQQAEEEFNQLAMNRLTRMRPARASARSQLGEVREVRSGAETLTVVNYRPGAASVLITEPPEAGFILEVRITLACLAREMPEPIAPPPGEPILPPSVAPSGDADALRALHRAIRIRLRPEPRPHRKFHAFCASWLQAGGVLSEPPVVPVPDPVWPDRLAMDFRLLGVEDLIRPEAPPPAPYLTAVPHAAIPSRRGPRPVPEFRLAPRAGEPHVPGPVLSAPRLRIHLPRPAFQPFRPRYGFAPPPPETPARESSSDPAGNVVSALPAGPVDAPEPVPAAVVASAAEVVLTAPSFGMAAARSSRDGWSRRRIAAAAAVVATVGALVFAWTSSPGAGRSAAAATAAQMKPALDPAVWSTSPAGDAAGLARARSFTAYQPARDKKDYRLEASARIDRQALGLVMRLRDPRNYYCWKVELPPSGGRGTTRLVQFAVVDGQEQAHRVTVFSRPVESDLRVRVEARGPVFTLHINGAAADTFTDGRIPSGGVGFSNESGERAVIRAVQVTD